MLEVGRVLYSISDVRMRSFSVYRLYPATEERLQYKNLASLAGLLPLYSMSPWRLRLSDFLHLGGAATTNLCSLVGCDFKSVQSLCSLMPMFLLEYSLPTTNEYSMVQRLQDAGSPVSAAFRGTGVEQYQRLREIQVLYDRPWMS